MRSDDYWWQQRYDDAEFAAQQANAQPTYGMCTACGAVEVALVNGVQGHRDLSAIGEHPRYPVGYGCEMCA
jgi:hypothetical protein